jgi:hypothetical protein
VTAIPNIPLSRLFATLTSSKGSSKRTPFTILFTIPSFLFKIKKSFESRNAILLTGDRVPPSRSISFLNISSILREESKIIGNLSCGISDAFTNLKLFILGKTILEHKMLTERMTTVMNI